MSFLSKIFGGGSTTTTVDPATQRYVDYMRQQAQGYASGRFPLPQEVQQAQQQFGQYGQAGLLGLGSLTGQNTAFMNPYLAQMNPYWQQQRDIAQSAAQDYATRAGAVGGDRAALLQGQALSDISNQQAAYNTQQFNEAQNRALQAAQLGYGAIGAQAFLPQQYASGQLGLLNQGIGPYGTTTSTHQSPFQTLLGAGLTAASIFGGDGLGGLAGMAGQSATSGGEGYIGAPGIPMDKSVTAPYWGGSYGPSPFGGGWR